MVFSGPTSCTQTGCKWLLPSHVTNMCYRPLADMDFSSARKRWKTFDSRLNAGSSASSVVSSCQPSTSSAGSSASSVVSSCQPSTSSAGSSASSVVSSCQPSTSSAGSSASSAASSCQPSTSSAGSSASSVAPTFLATTSSAPASKRSASATPTVSEIDDLFKIKSQCQLVPYKSDRFKALLWRTSYHSQIVLDYTYTKIVISELS